jgi:hypothetical protein
MELLEAMIAGKLDHVGRSAQAGERIVIPSGSRPWRSEARTDDGQDQAQDAVTHALTSRTFGPIGSVSIAEIWHDTPLGHAHCNRRSHAAKHRWPGSRQDGKGAGHDAGGSGHAVSPCRSVVQIWLLSRLPGISGRLEG